MIGNPVSHSLSPRMHAVAYQTLGLPYKYVAIRVDTGEVGTALDHLRAMGYTGINVTVPHKEEALAWCEDAQELAVRARAANTLNLQTKSCINTDAPGFLATLQEVPLSSKSALVLGAGGSARAIVLALMGAGFQVNLYNRTHKRAVELAEELGLSQESVLEVADPLGSALLVNTTSASLQNADLPIMWQNAGAEMVAYDLMYSKEPTPFMRAASALGLRAMDGRRMLMEQGALAFEWWTGLTAPRNEMLEALA